ncbi:MAG: serine hydrolase [Bacteroidia bacterium]
MKIRKKFFFPVLFFLMVLIAVIIWLSNSLLPVATGFAAKTMCSCVFVADRDEESVRKMELDRFAVRNTRVKVNRDAKSASASLLGLAKQTAIFREGLGCTLVLGITEDSLRNQPYANPRTKLPATDTMFWPTGDKDTLPVPENVQIEKVKLAVEQAFEENNPNGLKRTNAVVVVYRGKIIGEQYAPGFDKNTPQRGWSMTKSITNAILGSLAEESRVSVIQPIYAPEWASGDPRASLTLDQLLRMSSGLEFNEMYGSSTDVTRMLFTVENAGAYAASKPLIHQPDEVWNYSSGTTNIINRYLRFLYQDYNAYLRMPYENVFSRIGMSSAVMEVDASGTFVGSSFCYATPRDWAKFGLLFLNNGVWGGDRILSEGWVDYSRKRTTTDPYGRYGAHFWTNGTKPVPDDNGYHYWPNLPEDMYYASGFDGQYVVIVPSRDVVVVRLGVTTDRDAFDIGELVSGVLDAIQSEY